jgi:hypothetical protein
VSIRQKSQKMIRQIKEEKIHTKIADGNNKTNDAKNLACPAGNPFQPELRKANDGGKL